MQNDVVMGGDNAAGGKNKTEKINQTLVKRIKNLLVNSSKIKWSRPLPEGNINLKGGGGKIKNSQYYTP